MIPGWFPYLQMDDVKHLKKYMYTDKRQGLDFFIMLLFLEAKALIIPLSVWTYRKERLMLACKEYII